MDDDREFEEVIIRLAESGKMSWEKVARLALDCLSDSDIEWAFGEAGYLDDYCTAKRESGQPEPPDEDNGHED